MPVASTQPQHAGCSALQQPLPATAPAVKPPTPRRSARRRASRWSGARASATWSGSASGTGCACGGRRQRLARRAAAAWTWTPRRTACRWSRPRRSRPSPAARRFRRQLPPTLHWPYGKGYSDHPEVPECFHDGGALGAGARHRSIRTDAVGRSPYRNTGESLAMRYPTRLWDESVVRPDPILDLLVSSQLTPPYTLAHLAHDGTSRRRRQQVPGTTMADCEPLPRAPALW